MKTMATIDRLVHTSRMLGQTEEQAAEYRERGEWHEVHATTIQADKYREEVQRLRKQIKEAFDLND